MGKAKNEQPWKNPPQRNGVTHMRKYLDQCSEWIVDPSNDVENLSIPVLPGSQLFETTSCNNIGLVESELQHSKIFCCYMCGQSVCLGERGRVVVANPFTRAQYMLQCDTCKNS